MKFDWSSYLEVAKTLYHEAISTSNQANSASINEEDEIPFHKLSAEAIQALKCAERINRLLEKIKK